MRALGLQVYRFSLSWPRILPQGVGAVNPKGLDHYDRVIDVLLKAGIQPWITLYHWDLPQALQDRGGWPERFIIDAFAEYADVVSRRYGDRVKHWMTLDEPWVIAEMGHEMGLFAPGLRDPRLCLRAAYHLLLAHGRAYSVIKSNTPEAQVGITQVTMGFFNLGRDEETLQIEKLAHAKINGLYWEPVLRGTIPETLFSKVEEAVGVVSADDLRAMNQYDFFGIQYYNDMIIDPKSPHPLRLPHMRYPFYDYTEMDWPVTPRGIYDVIMRLWREYGAKRLIITENGSAWPDVLSHDGRVRDEKRQRYLKDHLAMVHKALQEGAPVYGYITWSLLDNFEWNKGYRPRFGLVYVDYPTQKRYIKDSGYLYRDIIAANGF